MTDKRESPWADRMPQVQASHEIATADFASILDTLTEVLNGRVCCPDHGAYIAVTLAIAALTAKHGADKLDVIDRDLYVACEVMMDNFRSGRFRPDTKRMEV